MEWTDLHARVLGLAFENVLGKPDPGSMAFVRCLTPDVAEALANDSSFAPRDWSVWLVSASNNEDERTITADRAVEMREAKGGTDMSEQAMREIRPYLRTGKHEIKLERA